MEINIRITDRRAQVLGSPVIVCGNTDNSIEFVFDDEWAASQTRTARFVYIQDGEVKYTDVVFNGSTATVPLLSNTREVQVGVFAGELRTTTPARIPCEPSILCGTGAPEDPTPSQYDQIIALLNEKQVLDTVCYSTQDLGEEQQSIARSNIGAASQASLDGAKTEFVQAIESLSTELNDIKTIMYDLTLDLDTLALSFNGDQTGAQLYADIEAGKNLSIRATSTEGTSFFLRPTIEAGALGVYYLELVTGAEGITSYTWSLLASGTLTGGTRQQAYPNVYELTWDTSTNAITNSDDVAEQLYADITAGVPVEIIVSNGTYSYKAILNDRENGYFSILETRASAIYTWICNGGSVRFWRKRRLSDETVEQHITTDDGWTCRLWESGEAECWGLATITLNVKDAYEWITGSGIYCASGYGPTPSNVFTSVSCIVANPRLYNELGVSARVTAGLNIEASIFGRNTAISGLKVGDTFSFNCLIKGRWK